MANLSGAENRRDFRCPKLNWRRIYVSDLTSLGASRSRRPQVGRQPFQKSRSKSKSQAKTLAPGLEFFMQARVVAVLAGSYQLL
ncbi:MAG: hypothetical protein Ct9H300mP11_18810 [Chloroflexota bacterium]|nr:MAG: hypothetical protein Ct9H300mP11_18810 [Chloroflexota bacterium]